MVEKGACHIRFDTVDGMSKNVSEEDIDMYTAMRRGSHVGTHTMFKQQSLDFFGDVVAGRKNQSDDEDIVLFRFSRKCFERIPIFEMHSLRQEDKQSMLPF